MQSRFSKISIKKLLVNNIRESILKTYPEKNKRCNMSKCSRTLFKAGASDRILYSSISFARDKAKLIKQLIPMPRRRARKKEKGSERENCGLGLGGQCSGIGAAERTYAKTNAGGRPPLGNQRCGRTGDFQFADSLRARYSWFRHSAATPFRSVVRNTSVRIPCQRPRSPVRQKSSDTK